MKIITGGQTGVDTGALLGAYDAGIDFSVLMPAEYKRESPAPDWLKEHAECLTTNGYNQRTRAVIYRSDAVLVIAPNLDSPGTRLTVQSAKDQNKPLWWYKPVNAKLPGIADNMTGEWGAIGHWLRMVERLAGDAVLMVAGPRASKWAQAEDFARTVVLRAFV